MCITLRLTTAFAVCAVVAPVSGFAQTNGVRYATVFGSSATAARVYSPAVDIDDGSASIPPNLRVPARLQSTVQSMLLKSPTFRRQCLRISTAPTLIVVLDNAPVERALHAQAVTRIIRRPDGGLTATMTIHSDNNAVELIAHEIEHVIEQLDGVELGNKALLASTGVRQCRCAAGAYETERAISVGERVAREVRGR